MAIKIFWMGLTMRLSLYLLIIGLLFCGTTAASDANNIEKAIVHTNFGDFTIALHADKAPISVANFINYAQQGFYNNTIFHRVIKRFVIQAGGFTPQLIKKNTQPPIINESYNGLHNDRWSVAMARSDDADSATSQFYINLRMNSSLDKQGKKPGYAVFGTVIDGFHVVQQIGKQITQNANGFSDLPIKTIIINSIELQ